MSERKCDLCGSPLIPVRNQPRGLRGGMRPRQPETSGYLCSNQRCERRNGNGMGWTGVAAE